MVLPKKLRSCLKKRAPQCRIPIGSLNIVICQGTKRDSKKMLRSRRRRAELLWAYLIPPAEVYVILLVFNF